VRVTQTSPRDRVFTAVVLLVITLLLSLTGALSRIDNVLYDTAQQHTDRPIPSDVVLVTIDEQSLSTIGRWPWSRRMHAQLIDQLHADGALVIGVDVMFSEPQQDDPGADALLAQAFARAGNVVLPVVIEQVRRNGQLIETLPLPALTAHAAALGRVHAELDADTIARSITLWEGLGQPAWPHFAQAMLTVAGQQPSNMTQQPSASPHQGPVSIARHDQRYINFTTAKRHLPSLSYKQVVKGEFAPGTFRGKLVLVGATASGMADSLPTPVSGLQQAMPGVEFLANALLSMRSQTLISLVPLWLSSLFACVVALVPMLWLPNVRARSGLLANTAFAVLLLGATMAMPVYLNIWLPLSAGILGVLSAYPLWAWRKLESASQFLEDEFTRLQEALGTQADVQQPKNKVPSDRFQRRIEQVRAATQQLQQLEQSQKETLAFVSHDIRVPLASASTQIEQALGAQHPARKQLLRALASTEDFLQITRAQMLKTDAFAELDLMDLLHQVADDIYPLAQARTVHLALDLPDEPVWVWGHFDTLSRAVSNLLSNALKFSPPGGTVGLSALLNAQEVNISVTDQGPGIPEKDLDKLFKRYSRLEHKGPHSQSGVGLGLYFVQTTLHKHGGRVQVTSRDGQTIFTLYLLLKTKQFTSFMVDNNS
jgi:CHASE2 domain-containing sensor protein/anti-sigma regulatory factor (Ser/Thr protein kinase)